MYYNYHGQIKKLINERHLTEYRFYQTWNKISPALVLFFDNHKPMPIRKEKWEEYFKILRIEDE